MDVVLNRQNIDDDEMTINTISPTESGFVKAGWR